MAKSTKIQTGVATSTSTKVAVGLGIASSAAIVAAGLMLSSTAPEGMDDAASYDVAIEGEDCE